MRGQITAIRQASLHSIDALKSGGPFTIIQFFFLASVLVHPLTEVHELNSMEVKWQNE